MTPPRHRFRFSLLSLMLIAALVCVSVSHWRLRQEHTALLSDREKLRDELGHLVVYNPEMVYVRQAHTEEPLTWKYRIYLPKGKYWLCAKDGTVTKHDYAAGRPRSFRGCKAGLFMLTVSFRKQDHRWHMALSTETEGSAKPIEDDVGEWVLKSDHPRLVPLRHRQKELPPDKRILVFHKARRVDDKHSRGIFVYIDSNDPNTPMSNRLPATAEDE